MKIKESLILEISDQNGETESIIIPDNSETTVKAAIQFAAITPYGRLTKKTSTKYM